VRSQGNLDIFVRIHSVGQAVFGATRAGLNGMVDAARRISVSIAAASAALYGFVKFVQAGEQDVAVAAALHRGDARPWAQRRAI
jgi:hypothetical protein